jgi:hypothetical protein
MIGNKRGQRRGFWRYEGMSAKLTIDASLRWPDVRDDYAVHFQGHSIGRVRLDGAGWVWSISIPMALPDWAEGMTASRDDSFKALAAAWGRLLSETSPERLQRAWDLEKAFEARRQKTAAVPPDAAPRA